MLVQGNCKKRIHDFCPNKWKMMKSFFLLTKVPYNLKICPDLELWFFLCKFNLRNSVHPFISIRYIIDNYWFIMFFIVKDIIYKLAPNLLLFKRQFQLPTVCCSPSPSGCIGPISPILFSAFYMGWFLFLNFCLQKQMQTNMTEGPLISLIGIFWLFSFSIII